MTSFKSFIAYLCLTFLLPISAMAVVTVAPKVVIINEFDSRYTDFSGNAFVLNEDSTGLIVDRSGLINISNGSRIDLTEKLRAEGLIEGNKFIQIQAAALSADKKRIAIDAAVANNPDYLESGWMNKPLNFYSAFIIIDVATSNVLKIKTGEFYNDYPYYNGEPWYKVIDWYKSKGYEYQFPSPEETKDFRIGLTFMQETLFQSKTSSNTYQSTEAASHGFVLENSSSLVVVSGYHRKILVFSKKDLVP